MILIPEHKSVLLHQAYHEVCFASTCCKKMSFSQKLHERQRLIWKLCLSFSVSGTWEREKFAMWDYTRCHRGMTYGSVGPRPSLRLKGRTKYLKLWTYFIYMICYRCFKPLQTIFHGCYVNEVVSFVNVANVSFDVNENVAFSGFASIFGHCVNNFCTINKVPSLQVAELWFRKLD